MLDTKFNNWRPGAVCPAIIGSQPEHSPGVLCLSRFEDGNTASLSRTFSALGTARIKHPLELPEELYARSSRQGGGSHNYISRYHGPPSAALWGASADAEDPTESLGHLLESQAPVSGRRTCGVYLGAWFRAARGQPKLLRTVNRSVNWRRASQAHSSSPRKPWSTDTCFGLSGILYNLVKTLSHHI